MVWNAYNTKDQSLFDNLIKSSQTLIDTRIQEFPFLVPEFMNFKNNKIREYDKPWLYTTKKIFKNNKFNLIEILRQHFRPRRLQ